MIPNEFVNNSMMTALGHDTITYDSSPNMNVLLSIANVTPGPRVVVADMVAPTWSGYAPHIAHAGPIDPLIDPSTGALTLPIVPATGGFLWVTGTDAAYPYNVYGYMLTDASGTINLGYEKFPVPQLITGPGEMVALPGVLTVMLPPGSLQ